MAGHRTFISLNFGSRLEAEIQLPGNKSKELSSVLRKLPFAKTSTFSAAVIQNANMKLTTLWLHGNVSGHAGVLHSGL